jgi:dihydrofolate reductase
VEGIQMKSLETKIIAVAAMSLDGKIAKHSGQFTDWTSPEDKEILHKHEDESDVIILGNNTYKTAQVPLSKRNCIVLTRSVATVERRSDNLLLYNPQGMPIEKVLGGYKTAVLLGGTEVYTYFLERDLIHEIYLTIEPVIMGSGLSFFDYDGELNKKFIGASIPQLLNEKGSVLLHYKYRRSS